MREAAAGLLSVRCTAADRDQLEVIRIGYTPQPSNNGPYHLDDWGGPHPMILHTDWRGMVDRATTARGRPMPCQLPLQCPQIRFPAATYKACNRSADLVEPEWLIHAQSSMQR